MKDKKRVILFDIDHTIFDTKKYLDLSLALLRDRLGLSDEDEFHRLTREIYKEQRTHAAFQPKIFVETLLKRLGREGSVQELGEIFFNPDIMGQSLYSDVETVLQDFAARPDVLLGIFSHGQSSHQRAKIVSIMSVFKDDSIYINEIDKIKQIPQVLSRHKDDQIYIIDDLMDVLFSFKSLDKSVVTILSKREGWKQKALLLDANFQPDFTITTFTQLRKII